MGSPFAGDVDVVTRAEIVRNLSNDIGSRLSKTAERLLSADRLKAAHIAACSRSRTVTSVGPDAQVWGRQWDGRRMREEVWRPVRPGIGR